MREQRGQSGSVGRDGEHVETEQKESTKHGEVKTEQGRRWRERQRSPGGKRNGKLRKDILQDMHREKKEAENNSATR